MTDWADDKAYEIYLSSHTFELEHIGVIAAALRSAHIDGLKEAREVVEAYGAERRFSCGNTCDEIAARIAELEKEAGK